MKGLKWWMLLLALAPCTLCVGAAFYLAAAGIEGWGWFIFAAMFLTPNIKNKSKKTKGKT